MRNRSNRGANDDVEHIRSRTHMRTGRPKQGRPPDRTARGGLKDVKAVVLAGGRGTRLAPYTTILPKPLMPVGERSILEIVVDQLEKAGVVDIRFSVGYLSHLIRAVFDNRDRRRCRHHLRPEEDALGTAAPLQARWTISTTRSSS